MTYQEAWANEPLTCYGTHHEPPKDYNVSQKYRVIMGIPLSRRW